MKPLSLWWVESAETTTPLYIHCTFSYTSLQSLSAMPKVYLLSRTLDPILGVFTGLLAYHLSETNPRSNIQPGHTLRDLIPWQLDQWKAERRAKELAQMSAVKTSPAAGAGAAQGDNDLDWDQLSKELEGEKAKSA